MSAWHAGDYARAEREARRGLQLAPKDRALHGIYQLTKSRSKPAGDAAATPQRPDAALARWMDASPLTDPRLKQAGERALARRRALQKLDEALRRLELGDARGALPILDSAARLDPMLPDVYMQRALAWGALRELAKALSEVTKAIELWTAQAKASPAADGLALRAQLRRRGGDYAGAAADAEHAIGLAPDKAGSCAERGQALEALGEKAAAVLADYRRAAELEPDLYTQLYQEALARHARQARPAPAARPGAALEPSALALAVLLALAGIAIWMLRRRLRAPIPAPR